MQHIPGVGFWAEKPSYRWYLERQGMNMNSRRTRNLFIYYILPSDSQTVKHSNRKSPTSRLFHIISPTNYKPLFIGDVFFPFLIAEEPEGSVFFPCLPAQKSPQRAEVIGVAPQTLIPT